MMMNLKEKVKELKIKIPIIFLAMKEKDTPILAKLLAAITVAYALSPIDLIPDFIPILGYLDDLILLPILVTCTVKLIPKEVLERCRIRSQNLWVDGKPKTWYYSLPIIVFWLVFILIIVRVFMHI